MFCSVKLKPQGQVEDVTIRSPSPPQSSAPTEPAWPKCKTQFSEELSKDEMFDQKFWLYVSTHTTAIDATPCVYALALTPLRVCVRACACVRLFVCARVGHRYLCRSDLWSFDTQELLIRVYMRKRKKDVFLGQVQIPIKVCW